MPNYARLVGYLVGVSASLIVVSAYSNGRTTPRPSGMTLVKAICVERDKADRQELLRARVIGSGKSADSLNVRIGQTNEQMSITAIRTLTFPSASIDAGGFMSASLVSNDDDKEKRVMVQVRSGKANLRLAGFSSDGSNVNIDLYRCATVTFTRSDSKE